MNRQIKQNLSAQPNCCVNAYSGNKYGPSDLSRLAKDSGCIRVFLSNGEMIALLSNERSETFIELEFIPLEKWVSGEFIEGEVTRQIVYFQDQEFLHGIDSRKIRPGDWDYDVDHEVEDILSNLSDYYTYKMEVCHA